MMEFPKGKILNGGVSSGKLEVLLCLECKVGVASTLTAVFELACGFRIIVGCFTHETKNAGQDQKDLNWSTGPKYTHRKSI